MKFAIIGFGGLGKVHFRNLAAISEKVADLKLVALCDVDKNAFSMQKDTNLSDDNTNLNLGEYHLYTDVDELLKKEELDFVITALPTHYHADIGIKVMEYGINLFSEKPMALTVEQAEKMIKSSEENHVKLMIGHCVRYFPAYVFLKEMIDSKKYGRVIKADFSRISPNITWNRWMLDESKSGGAALDLHIHDVDYIQYVFGVPEAVTSFATNHKTKHESITTIYQYEDKLVSAVGDWGMPGCYSFAAGFTVRFEEATVVMNSEGVVIYPEVGEVYKAEIPTTNGYVEEIVDFINCLKTDTNSTINPPEDSLQTLKIAIAEKNSADMGKRITIKQS